MAAEAAICERCRRERAFVRVTDCGGARLLCLQCFQLGPPERHSSIDLARFFVLLSDPRSGGPLPVTEPMDPAARCLACGLTFAELVDEGSMGCQACYVAFRPAVISGLQALAV